MAGSFFSFVGVNIFKSVEGVEFLNGWVNSVHGERFSERFSEGSDVFATTN